MCENLILIDFALGNSLEYRLAVTCFCRNYLNSPFFLKDKSLLKLYDSIERLFYKKDKIYKEEKIVERNYSKYSTSNIKKYNKELGKLKKHISNFLAHMQLSKQETDIGIICAEDYLTRQEGAFFELQLKATQKTLDTSLIDLFYYNKKYYLEELKYTYRSFYKDKRMCDLNLQNVSDALDLDFIYKKLCFTVIMLNRANITSSKFKFGLYYAIEDFIKDKHKYKPPVIWCWYYAYKIVSDSNETKAFKELIELLKANRNQFSYDIVLSLYTIIINNINRISEPDKKHEELVQIFLSDLLSNGYLHTNGKISAQTLKNITTVCLNLEMYDYLENFILDHMDRIFPASNAKESYNYNMARLHLYNRNYDKVRDLINDINKEDAYYKFGSSRLDIMLYYDIEEWRLLDASVDTFRVLLSRKKNGTPKKHIESERNFINNFSEIYRIKKKSKSKKSMDEISQKIKSTANVAEKKWLVMKAKEI